MLNKTRWRNSSTVLASYCFLCIRNKPKEFSNGCGANSFLTSKNKKWRFFCPVSCTAMIKKGLCTTCCIYAPVLWKSVFLKCRVSATSPFISDLLVPWLRSFKQTWIFTLFTNGVSKLCDKVSCRNLISCSDPSSEPEQVDKLLRWKRGGASLWVVGCAGVISTLGKEKTILFREAAERVPKRQPT